MSSPSTHDNQEVSGVSSTTPTPPKQIKLPLWTILPIIGLLLGVGIVYIYIQYPKWQKARTEARQKEIVEIVNQVLIQSLTYEQDGQRIPIWIKDIQRALVTSTQ